MAIQDTSQTPAFPTIQDQSHEQRFVTTGGLTKREYFAAMAMQGLYSNSAVTKKWARAMIVRESIDAADAIIFSIEKEHHE